MHLTFSSVMDSFPICIFVYKNLVRVQLEWSYTINHAAKPIGGRYSRKPGKEGFWFQRDALPKVREMLRDRLPSRDVHIVDVVNESERRKAAFDAAMAKD